MNKCWTGLLGNPQIIPAKQQQDRQTTKTKQALKNQERDFKDTGKNRMKEERSKDQSYRSTMSIHTDTHIDMQIYRVDVFISFFLSILSMIIVIITTTLINFTVKLEVYCVYCVFILYLVPTCGSGSPDWS